MPGTLKFLLVDYSEDKQISKVLIPLTTVGDNHCEHIINPENKADTPIKVRIYASSEGQTVFNNLNGCDGFLLYANQADSGKKILELLNSNNTLDRSKCIILVTDNIYETKFFETGCETIKVTPTYDLSAQELLNQVLKVQWVQDVLATRFKQSGQESKHAAVPKIVDVQQVVLPQSKHDMAMNIIANAYNCYDEKDITWEAQYNRRRREFLGDALELLTKKDDKVLDEILVDVLCQNIAAVTKYADLKKTSYGRLHRNLLNQFPELAVPLFYQLISHVFYYRFSSHRISLENILDALEKKVELSIRQVYVDAVNERDRVASEEIKKGTQVYGNEKHDIRRVFVAMAYQDEKLSKENLKDILFKQGPAHAYVLRDSAELAEKVYINHCGRGVSDFAVFELHISNSSEPLVKRLRRAEIGDAIVLERCVIASKKEIAALQEARKNASTSVLERLKDARGVMQLVVKSNSELGKLAKIQNFVSLLGSLTKHSNDFAIVGSKAAAMDKFGSIDPVNDQFECLLLMGDVGEIRKNNFKNVVVECCGESLTAKQIREAENMQDEEYALFDKLLNEEKSLSNSSLLKSVESKEELPSDKIAVREKEIAVEMSVAPHVFICNNQTVNKGPKEFKMVYVAIPFAKDGELAKHAVLERLRTLCISDDYELAGTVDAVRDKYHARCARNNSINDNFYVIAELHINLKDYMADITKRFAYASIGEVIVLENYILSSKNGRVEKIRCSKDARTVLHLFVQVKNENILNYSDLWQKLAEVRTIISIAGKAAFDSLESHFSLGMTKSAAIKSSGSYPISSPPSFIYVELIGDFQNMSTTSFDRMIVKSDLVVRPINEINAELAAREAISSVEDELLLNSFVRVEMPVKAKQIASSISSVLQQGSNKQDNEAKNATSAPSASEYEQKTSLAPK